MAGKGDGQGANLAKLENQINTIKYSIFCLNVIAWVGKVVVISLVFQMILNGVLEMFDLFD